MTEPVPTPFPFPSEIAYALRCLRTAPADYYPDIFLVFHNGLVRHCLPVEWAEIQLEGHDDFPLITGNPADFAHASALAKALKV